jgi:hypothetical protein
MQDGTPAHAAGRQNRGSRGPCVFGNSCIVGEVLTFSWLRFDDEDDEEDEEEEDPWVEEAEHTEELPAEDSFLCLASALG